MKITFINAIYCDALGEYRRQLGWKPANLSQNMWQYFLSIASKTDCEKVLGIDIDKFKIRKGDYYFYGGENVIIMKCPKRSMKIAPEISNRAPLFE
jgi:hypothetical protein